MVFHPTSKHTSKHYSIVYRVVNKVADRSVRANRNINMCLILDGRLKRLYGTKRVAPVAEAYPR